jgi:hypothetical protein
MEKHYAEKILKLQIAKDAFLCIKNGLNSAILRITIRDDCLTPASQTPVSGWWGMHPVIPPGSSTAHDRSRVQLLLVLKHLSESEVGFFFSVAVIQIV